jgi:hypothetical protein
MSSSLEPNAELPNAFSVGIVREDVATETTGNFAVVLVEHRLGTQSVPIPAIRLSLEEALTQNHETLRDGCSVFLTDTPPKNPQYYVKQPRLADEDT